MRTLRGRARLGIVMLIIAVVTTVAVAAVAASLHRTIFEDKLGDLQDLASAEARLIATIARLESRLNDGDPAAATTTALDRVRDGLQSSGGFGRTGEITVGRSNGDLIEFVGSNRADEPIASAPPGSPNGEPMRRALQGRSGTVVARDYRGVEVLAAYEWVPALEVGVVAKMDIGEVRGMMWPAVYLSAALGAVLVVCGALLILIMGENFRRDLVKERERYRALFEGSRDGLFVQDGDRIEEVNDRACELSKRAREELIGGTAADFFPPTQADGRSSRAVMLEKTLAAMDGTPQRFDWQFIRGDGLLMEAAVTLTPIELDNQRKLLVTLQDVTQRRRKAEIRRRLQAVLESTIDAVGMADADGRITYMNAAARQLLGLGRDEDVTERPITGFNAPEIAESLLAAAARDGSWAGEVTLWRVDGTEVPVSQVVVAHQDATGATAYYSTIIRDLSSRRATERQTRRLAAAIGQISEGILITDAEGRIEYVNDALTRITGYGAAELLGENPRILKSGHHDDTFYKRLWDTVGRGEIWKGQLVNQRKDGTFYQEEMTITPIRCEGGGIQSYVAVKRDITEQVLLESQLQQAQKMEAIGQLAGGVAHDFNNMLTGITGYAQLVLRDADNERERADLQQVLELSHRAADLTQQLLAISRRQQLEQVSVNLNTLIGNTMKMLGRLIPENIETEFHASPDLHPVMADSGQMVQVLMNLAVNGRDAIQEGGKLVI
jgi:PAS domain S-box-containing protein